MCLHTHLAQCLNILQILWNFGPVDTSSGQRSAAALATRPMDAGVTWHHPADCATTLGKLGAKWAMMLQKMTFCAKMGAQIYYLAQLATLATLIRIHYLVKPLHTDAVYIV